MIDSLLLRILLLHRWNLARQV